MYSQDADWNALLQQSSESVIQNQVDLWEFLKGFTNFPEDIPLQNIRPALSAVIYKTQCAMWKPNNFIKGLEKTWGALIKFTMIIMQRKTYWSW